MAGAQRYGARARLRCLRPALLAAAGGGMALAAGSGFSAAGSAAAVAAIIWFVARRADSQRRLAERLAAERAALSEALAHQERLASVGTLAASVAHDARNSLVSAHTFFQLAPERWEDLEFRTHYATLVGREIERARELLTRLLELSRRPPETDAQEIDLQKLVEDVAELLGPRARRRGVTLSVDSGGVAPTITGSPAELRQVLVNLVLNGIDAAGDGGEVRLRIESPGNPHWAEVVVSDSGPGIDSSQAARIFERFYTTKPDGTGLGLAVVREIVEKQGGRVAVDAGSGKGASFRVRLPVRHGQRRAA